MGTPKAALEWHGSTLLRRVTGIVARATGGPAVVVRAPGQELPPLPASVEVTEDEREGRGPLQGLAAGLAALDGRAEVAFVSSTDAPLLHPAFVRLVVGALDGEHDVALPLAAGFPHPLAAAYRTTLLPAVEQLIAADRMRPAFLFEGCRVRRLDEAALLADPAVAAFDPALDSVLNLNEPADYEAARARPAPEVVVRCFGALRRELRRRGSALVHAATLAAAAAAAGVELGDHVVAALNGDQITRDPGSRWRPATRSPSSPPTPAGSARAAAGTRGLHSSDGRRPRRLLRTSARRGRHRRRRRALALDEQPAPLRRRRRARHVADAPRSRPPASTRWRPTRRWLSSSPRWSAHR